ncbi:hypothetical protein JWG44_11315 [Leptospira sp. 201903071]|uniref:hypothetical protein n=1 Tax=Leptospira ainazelensis TaxID=2810034 RepID=UPI0019660908|nr:hypothetical protein [Leptospira ainazelensis]MBM9500837.1 hypothetical protein [Leptospira ainazelensis]
MSHRKQSNPENERVSALYDNNNKEESLDSISAKKSNYYPNHPLNEEIEKKVEELKISCSLLPELKPFLEQLSLLPWEEYEKKLSIDYLKKFTFVKEELDETYKALIKEDPGFFIQEPNQILKNAHDILGIENKAYSLLNNYISNLIALTMQRAVSSALKQNL